MTSTSYARADHRFDQWQSQICETFVPLHAHASGAVQRFRGGVSAHTLGQVIVAEVAASPAVVERTPHLIRREDPELYKLGVLVAGQCVIQQDDREAAIRPGDCAIYDTSRPYRLAFGEGFRMIVAMFPRALVQLPTTRMSDLTATRLPGDQGLSGLLAPFLRGLPGAAEPGTAERGSTTAHLGDAVVDLVTATFAQRLATPVPWGDPARRALVAQAYRFIDTHLSDPQLTSTAIAANLFVSVRWLQKVFAAEGTSVSAVIRHRRLELCRRDLTDPQQPDRSIAAVAARRGFTDPAHFSRLFRAAYGVSPSQYRHDGGTGLFS